ncbi:hypothetical protein C0993_009138 [Termitomyces sp. T159_Od127]|nr:hypothetical protein C0993_009138 [Termitomyces sp. T159_Od127]
MSIVHIGVYATNWKIFPFFGPQKQPDGTYVLSLPAKSNKPYPMIDARKDTGHLVYALLQVPPGKTVMGFGSMISWDEYMKLWGNILGIPGCRFQEIDLDTAAKLVPGNMEVGYDIAEGIAFIGEFGFAGGDFTVLYPQDVSIRRCRPKFDNLTQVKLGVDCPTTSMETYIQKEDWSSIL